MRITVWKLCAAMRATRDFLSTRDPGQGDDEQAVRALVALTGLSRAVVIDRLAWKYLQTWMCVPSDTRLYFDHGSAELIYDLLKEAGRSEAA